MSKDQVIRIHEIEARLHAIETALESKKLQKEQLTREVDELAASREKLRSALETLLEIDNFKARNPQNVNFGPAPRKTPDMIRVLLAEEPVRGMPTSRLLEEIKKRWDPDVKDQTVRTSLVRMKGNELRREGRNWVLVL